MNTQLERNNLIIAAASYRSRQRRGRLIGSLAAFFLTLTIICAALCIIIPALPY